jgi:hypothetical protein
MRLAILAPTMIYILFMKFTNYGSEETLLFFLLSEA